MSLSLEGPGDSPDKRQTTKRPQKAVYLPNFFDGNLTGTSTKCVLVFRHGNGELKEKATGASSS